MHVVARLGSPGVAGRFGGDEVLVLDEEIGDERAEAGHHEIDHVGSRLLAPAVDGRHRALLFLIRMEAFSSFDNEFPRFVFGHPAGGVGFGAVCLAV